MRMTPRRKAVVPTEPPRNLGEALAVVLFVVSDPALLLWALYVLLCPVYVF